MQTQLPDTTKFDAWKILFWDRWIWKNRVSYFKRYQMIDFDPYANWNIRLKNIRTMYHNSNISTFYKSWNQYFGTVWKRRLSTFKFIDLKKIQVKIHRYYGCRIPLEINEKTLNRILEFSEKKNLYIRIFIKADK